MQFFISLAFSTAVPALFLYVFARTGVTSAIDVPERKDRYLPFAMAMGSYSLGSVLLIFAHSPPLVTAFMMCYLVNTAVISLISLRWKISVHATGVAGPAVILSYAMGAVALVFLLLIIPVAWARISLKAHSLAQVAAGFILTPAVTYVQLIAYLTALH